MRLYYTPLRALADTRSMIFTHDELDALFSNLPEVLAVHESLLDAMEASPSRLRPQLLAFAMGQHERLGAGSPVRLLGPDVMRHVWALMISECAAVPTSARIVGAFLAALRRSDDGFVKAHATYVLGVELQDALLRHYRGLSSALAKKSTKARVLRPPAASEISRVPIECQLVMPTSRLARYRRQFHYILQCTDAASPEHAQVSELLALLNSASRRLDNLLEHRRCGDPQRRRRDALARVLASAPAPAGSEARTAGKQGGLRELGCMFQRAVGLALPKTVLGRGRSLIVRVNSHDAIVVHDDRGDVVERGEPRAA